MRCSLAVLLAVPGGYSLAVFIGCIYWLCPVAVHWLSDGCPLPVYRLPVECPVAVHWLPTGCP